MGFAHAWSELPLLGSIVLAALPVCSSPRPVGAPWAALLLLPLGAASALGFCHFYAGAKQDTVVHQAHTMAVALSSRVGMWGFLFLSASAFVKRQHLPPRYAGLAIALSVWTWQRSALAVHGPVFVGTIVTSLPAVALGGRSAAPARSLLLALALFAGAGVAADRAPPDGPLSSDDVLHLCLAAGVLAVRATLAGLRARPESRSD